MTANAQAAMCAMNYEVSIEALTIMLALSAAMKFQDTEEGKTMNEINWMQQGWECPKCGAVMAPHVDCCVNCRGNKDGGMATTITNPITVKPVLTIENPIFNEPSSICASSKEDPEKQWERYYLNV